MKNEIVVKIKVKNHMLRAVLFEARRSDSANCYRIVLLAPLPADVDGDRFEADMVDTDGRSNSVIAENSLPKSRQCYLIRVLLG